MEPSEEQQESAGQESAVRPSQYITPDWLRLYIAESQKDQDHIDAQSLQHYERASTDWVTNNVLKREQEGANFTPTAPPPLPTITTFFDGGGFMDQRTVPNPAAKPPVLPPPIKTTPDQPGFGGTGAGARDAQMFSMLNAIIGKLSRLEAALIK